jgi:hypothetical protein
VRVDPFALPCHPDLSIAPEDRDWRAIGVKSADEVLRKQTRCPECKTAWTAFARTFRGGTTVEWVRPTPFRVSAAPVDGGPLWQDAAEGAWTAPVLPADRDSSRAELQEATAGLGPAWERSAQLCTASYVLTAGGEVVAEPGELLLERREKWNAQDRRLALLWAPRVERPVVAWHGFSRLLTTD